MQESILYFIKNNHIYIYSKAIVLFLRLYVGGKKFIPNQLLTLLYFSVEVIRPGRDSRVIFHCTHSEEVTFSDIMSVANN